MSATDKLLFTPGPLTTSATVKGAMLRDLGSRDEEFIEIVRRVRRRLLALAGVSQEAGYEAVPIQGSGTFGMEAVISSVTPPEGKWLVVINGAYGERIARIAAAHRIAVTPLRYPEDRQPLATDVGQALEDDPSLTHVAVVHCETTTGIMNPVEAIGSVARAAGKRYFVDSMSAFGAVPFSLDGEGLDVDFLVSSANKCIEGVPGFCFIIANREALLETEGWARTVSLDLLAQWRGLEANGQFRFTPPTQAILAFDRALDELEEEGGVVARAKRYGKNHATLVRGMRSLGFEEYIAPESQGTIIVTFRYPPDPAFHFETLYQRLSRRGFVIYPGKVSQADCFRIGTIGRLHEGDFSALVEAIREILEEMGVRPASSS